MVRVDPLHGDIDVLDRSVDREYLLDVVFVDVARQATDVNFRGFGSGTPLPLARR